MISTSQESSNDSNNNNSFHNKTRLLRALLMVPPHYQTPWLAAWQWIKFLQQQQNNNSSSSSSNSDTNSSQSTRIQPYPRSLVRSSITEIQCLLQQTVSLWWEQERRRNSSSTSSWVVRPHNPPPSPRITQESDKTGNKSETARYWILRLVQTLMKPLLLLMEDEQHQHQQEEDERGVIALPQTQQQHPNNDAEQHIGFAPPELVNQHQRA